MAEVVLGLLALAVGVFYLVAPFVALAAWRRARRLEAALTALECRVAASRFETAVEPLLSRPPATDLAAARPATTIVARPIPPEAELDLPWSASPSAPRPPTPAPREVESAHRDSARVEPPVPAQPSPVSIPAPREAVAVSDSCGSAVDDAARMASSWEERIGGGVLSKAGALLVVIGVALFVGWSMMNLGPGGRVAIALALSGILLAGGLALQRWPDYAGVALGLSAAGWGGLYVTVYAMHGLKAARMVDDPRLALGLLLVVAGGMIMHALWLEIPALVAVAYAAAFAAVALGPPSSFAAVACAVLAGTLLVVAARRGWSTFAVAGLLCTYGVLAFRLPPADDGGTLLPAMSAGMAILWACWSMFELYDVAMAARTQEAAGRVIAPVNLCGLLGVALLHSQPPFVGLDRFLVTASAAYGISTLARLVLGRRRGHQAAAATAGPELAVTIAAALWAAALWIRFGAGWRLHVGLLMEAEILFLLGVAVGWRHLRTLAVIGFAALLVRFVACDVPRGGEVTVGGVTLARWTPSAVWAAVVLLANRAILARIGRPLLAGETLATSAATALTTMVIGGEAWQRHLGLSLAMLGFAWLVLAWILMEFGIRLRFAEAYLQACVVACLALVPLGLVNAFPIAVQAAGSDAVPAWAWLGPAVGMLHAIGWRLTGSPRFPGVEPAERDVSQAVLVAATSFAILLAWHALPAPLVALAWAGYAVAAFGVGAALPHGGLRWHAYGVVALTVARLFIANFTTVGMTGIVSHRLLTVVPVILVLYGLAIRLAGARLGAPMTAAEQRLGPLFSWIGTVVLLVLLRFELGRVLTVGGWAAVGLVLLLLGQRRGTASLRWQSHAIALLTFTRSWGTGFAAPEAPVGLLSPVWLGGFVVVCLFVSELLCPAEVRLREPPRRPGELLGWLDAFRRPFYAILATSLLAILLVHEVPPGLLTAALGIEGAALLVAGFVRPDHSLRACGLAVLGLGVAKLFFHDLRHLETPYRILSFILLGILLLVASWTYTRFKPRLRGLP